MIGNRAQVTSPAATVSTGTLPIPSAAGDGADILPMRSGSYGHWRMLVTLDGSATQTVTTGVLWGFRLGEWVRIKALNAGAVITITSATQGYAEVVEGAGLFERLAVSGTVSAGTTAQRFEPIELAA